MPPHIVHIAGVPIRAGNVIRQRCAWCGALIDEIDLERVAWQDDGENENPFIDAKGDPKTRWQGLVAVEGGDALIGRWAVPDPDDEKIPEDSCMAFDRVTGP